MLGNDAACKQASKQPRETFVSWLVVVDKARRRDRRGAKEACLSFISLSSSSFFFAADYFLRRRNRISAVLNHESSVKFADAVCVSGIEMFGSRRSCKERVG
jgi:hypothetical protein